MSSVNPDSYLDTARWDFSSVRNWKRSAFYIWNQLPDGNLSTSSYLKAGPFAPAIITVLGYFIGDRLLGQAKGMSIWI